MARRYKNVELAEMYKVSEKSIRNWIESAKNKKLSLDLIHDEDKAYIADSPTNHIKLKNLASKGKKFKNKKSLREISPKEDFYSIFNEKQIIDIISDLEVHREIDLKFGYFHTGADSYNKYIEKSLEQTVPSTPTNTIELLDLNLDYIYSLVKKFKSVNIIDIGPGNSLPLKKFLQFLNSKDILKKYIAIDYSADMLKYSKSNIKRWFKDKVPFEGHLGDVNTDVFRDLIFRNSVSLNQKDTVNLILFFGSTIENQRRYDRPLYVIKNSIGSNDLFFLGHRLDTESAKLTLSFNNQSTSRGKDLELFFVVLDLLNISEDLYEVERLYDDFNRSRIMRINLKFDIKIKIKTQSFHKQINLYKNDKIVLFRHKHHTYQEVIDEVTKVGFEILHASTSMDRDQILVISHLKSINN